MPIHLSEESDGAVLAIRVSGRLTRADYGPFVPAFDRYVRRQGRARVLFDMTGFHGWDAGAAWEDFRFGVGHFSNIERFAMLGQKKWHQGMARLCKPFTNAAVRYFDHTDAAKAREWLAEGLVEA